MEGKTDIFEELRQKFLTTYLLAMAYWVPLQAANFALVPHAHRVLFISVCTFLEINGLCLLKRWDPREGDKDKD